MSGSSGDQDRTPGRISLGERAGFKRRLSDLDNRLDKVRTAKEPTPQTRRTRASNRAMSYGFRMVTDLVAAVLVGGIFGYFLDRWLGTTPWLLLGFLLLGSYAGIRNTMRTYQRMQADIAAATGGNIGRDLPDDEDD